MSNPEEPKKLIHESVLAAIEAGRIKMKPKWQFVLQAVLFTVGLILAILAMLFIGSFIVFLLEQNGAWFAPALGTRGYRDLFFALPLVFIAVAIVFVILVQVMVRRYSFSYGRPLVYSVAGVTLLVLLGSVLIAQTHIHEDLFLHARNQQLPIIGGFYLQFGGPQQADHITPGKIIEKTDSGFNMNDPQQQQFTVIITPDTHFLNTSDFEPGDYVIVLGDRIGNTITADGVREVEPRNTLFYEQHEQHEQQATPQLQGVQ